MAEGYKDWAPGEILTAADLEDYTVKQSVMVFDDASARTTALSGVLREGMVSYLKDTDSLELYDGSAWAAVGGATMIKKVEAFTASGTWTVPAGVTYAIAHIRGGGGGATFSGLGTSGGSSSVAFAGGTITAAGGNGAGTQFAGGSTASAAPAVNSGEGGYITQLNGDKSDSTYGGRGAYIVAADTVTPAASITVTVGAGGTGNRAGATGYVWIEYYEEA